MLSHSYPFAYFEYLQVKAYCHFFYSDEACAPPVMGLTPTEREDVAISRSGK